MNSKEELPHQETGKRFVDCPIALQIIGDQQTRFRELFGSPKLLPNFPKIATALQSSADRIAADLHAKHGISQETTTYVRERLAEIGLDAPTCDEVFTILFDSLEFAAQEEEKKQAEQSALQREADAWLQTLKIDQLPQVHSAISAPLRASGWRHPLQAISTLGRTMWARLESGNVLCVLDVNGKPRTFVRSLPLPTQSAGYGSTVDMHKNMWRMRFEALRNAVEARGGSLTAITSEALGGNVPVVAYQGKNVHMIDHHRIMAAMYLGLPIETVVWKNGEGIGG